MGKISETGEATPTKFGFYAFHINLYLHEFLSRHRSAETLCWLWYVVVVVGLISIFMNPMRMRLNYKMASTSSNKIKLAAGV